MRTIVVPYHLDERLSGFSAGVPVDQEVSVDLPVGGPWERMAALYQSVAEAVAGSSAPPLVISGDCTTSLGVLAGLQRSGRDVGVVWFDAHADFHTERSTVSGYLGGMPLALAAGVGDPTLPSALGLRSVPTSQIVLVDARDTDPGEHVLLSQHTVTVWPVTELAEADLPNGDLYLHLDVDVCDPLDVPDLLYPTPGGPGLADVLQAVRRVTVTGRVAAIGLAQTWRHDGHSPAAHQDVMQQLHQAITG